MTEKDQIVQQLTMLVTRIEELVGEGIQNATLVPQKRNVVRWKVQDFNYTDNGPEIRRRETSTAVVDLWDEARKKVKASVRGTPEFTDAESLCASSLERFVETVIRWRVDKGQLTNEDKSLFIESFVDNLNDRPVQCHIHVLLDGLVLRKQSLEFTIDDIEVATRQTRAEDYEAGDKPFDRPTAILALKLRAKDVSEVGKQVARAVALLRLYKIGGITTLVYHVSSFSSVGLKDVSVRPSQEEKELT